MCQQTKNIWAQKKNTFEPKKNISNHTQKKHQPEGALLNVIVGALHQRVAQKGAEQTRVGVCAELEQPRLTELEGAGELCVQLVDAVEPLQEDGRALALVGVGVGVAVPLRELVAEEEPVVVDEGAEAGERAVVGVEQELGEREDLGRAVPAVAAVDQHRLGLAVDWVGDGAGCLEDGGEVVQPLGVLELAVESGRERGGGTIIEIG